MIKFTLQKRIRTTVTVFLLSPLIAFAQGTTPSATDQTSKEPTSSTQTMSKESSAKSGKPLSRTEQRFVQQAAQDGLAEIQLGQLAMQKAQTPAVKTFAQQIVQDHQNANQDLENLAESKNITLPENLNTMHSRKIKSLEKLSGTEFDKAYMKEMNKDHDKSMKNFQKQANKTSDSDLKAFIDKTLPVLTEHKNLIDDAQAAIQTSAAKTQ